MRLLLALLTVAGAHDIASACGGLFCNATVPVGQPGPTRIVQDGERVLFIKTDTGVTMVVEVRYDGEPTSFAWLLPIPALPPASSLEDALDVSVPELFTTLQAATDPTFTVNVQNGALGRCGGGGGGGGIGCGDADMEGAGTVGESNTIGGSGSLNPYVTISDQARVGAYDALHIEATNADALYAWLGANGYFQDENARPLLKDYIDDGWSFIALKLQNGASKGDIRPIVLHLGEEAPCVPLRLTRIAANDDMPIFVWVVGEGRAIPKNFVHAVVNDEAVSFPNGPDYIERLKEAVDMASGRAWVTEHAAPADTVGGRFFVDREVVDTASRYADIVFAVPSNLWGPTLSRILREELVKPAELTDEEWASYSLADGLYRDDLALVNDLETFRARVLAELVEPIVAITDELRSDRTITRFFTVQDAAEMTKDPIFGFNPSLPAVSNQHVIVAKNGTDDECNPIWEVTYATGSTFRPVASVVAQSGFAARAGVSPLLRVEVLDEEGPARPFDPTQAAAVDVALDGATLGIPSIPSGFVLKPAPGTTRKKLDPGCGMSLPAAYLLVPLAFLWVRRRYSSM